MLAKQNLRSLSWILMLVLLVVAGRWTLHIPWPIDLPITGQTIIVLISAYYLSFTQIFILYFSYLLGGTVLELPFFADGTYGIDKLMGKSGGYLYGFLAAALVIRYYAPYGGPILSRGLAFLLGTGVILVIGMLHLSTHIGLADSFTYGVKPYVVGGLVKALIALSITILVDQLTTRLAS